MFEDVRNVANAEAETVEVQFEPWGAMSTLPPGASLRVTASSRVEGALEIVIGAGTIAVYAWPGCTMKVHRDGVLDYDFTNEFPDLPPGMSTREFIDFMFGGPGMSSPPARPAPTGGFWERIREWWRSSR